MDQRLVFIVIAVTVLIQQSQRAQILALGRPRTRFDYAWCNWTLDSWSEVNFIYLLRYVE